MRLKHVLLCAGCSLIIAQLTLGQSNYTKPHNLPCGGHELPFDYKVEKGANGIIVAGTFSVGTRKTVGVNQVAGYYANLKYVRVGETITVTIVGRDIDEHVCEWLKNGREDVANKLHYVNLPAEVVDLSGTTPKVLKSFNVNVLSSDISITVWSGSFVVPNDTTWIGKKLRIRFPDVSAKHQLIDDDAPCTATDGVSHDGNDSPFDMSVVLCDFTVLLVNILVDTDRNGTIDGADEPGKNDFTRERGAVILANRDRDNGLAMVQPDCDDGVVNGTTDVGDLSKIHILPTGFSTMPAGLRMVLRINPGDKIRIFKRPLDGEQEIVGPTAGLKEIVVDETWITGRTTPWILGAEATKYIAEGFPFVRPEFKGRLGVSLVLQELDGTWSDIIEDNVVLQVAPCELAWNGQSVEKVYAAPDIYSEVKTLLSVPVEKGIAAADPWFQDFVEIANNRHSNGSRIPGILDLKHHFDAGWPQKLWENNNDFGLVKADHAGNGGDIEVTCPYAAYPLGRIFHGSHVIDVLSAFFKFADAQIVQEPRIKLDTDWLLVGHVDEFVQFLPSSSPTVLRASPRDAADILHVLERRGRGATTILCGTKDITGNKGQKYTVEELLVMRRGSDYEKTTLTASVPAGSTTLSLSDGRFIRGDYLRIDNEIVRVKNKPTLTTVTITDAAGLKSSHPPGSLIYCLSPLMRENIVGYTFGGALYPSVESTIKREVSKLENEMGVSLREIQVPVIFIRRPSESQFVAFTPDFANCLLAEGKAIMGKSDGPVVNSQNFFHQVVQARLSGQATPCFIDSWSLHLQDGDVHCGSNSKRKPLSTMWWAAWK